MSIIEEVHELEIKILVKIMKHETKTKISFSFRWFIHVLICKPVNMMRCVVEIFYKGAQIREKTQILKNKASTHHGLCTIGQKAMLRHLASFGWQVLSF